MQRVSKLIRACVISARFALKNVSDEFWIYKRKIEREVQFRKRQTRVMISVKVETKAESMAQL